MLAKSLNYQPTAYTQLYVVKMRTIRYLQTGILLHFMTILGVFLFVFCGMKAIHFFTHHKIVLGLLFSYFSLYGFTLPFFSQLDARSRYQNYKLLKDKLYTHGYDERLIRPFVFSRCQRDAIIVAAKAFGEEEKMQGYFKQLGFKWYHILPTMVVSKPSLLFTKTYWSKTLFVPTYHSKHFLW